MSQYHIVVRQGRPYLRKKPYTYQFPTLRQQVHQARMAKIAYALYGEAKGHENGLPVVAARVKKELKGKTILPEAPEILELTPYQYVDLLMQIEERQLKGEKIVLSDILRQRNLRISIVMPPEIEVPAE